MHLIQLSTEASENMHHRSHSQTHNDQLSPLQPQIPYLKCTFGCQYSITEPTKQQLKKNIFKR